MQLQLHALRQIAPNRGDDRQLNAPLYNAHSLNRDEFFQSLPMPLKFVQQNLPALSAMRQLELSHVNRINAQRLQRICGYLLGVDIAVQIRRLHLVERQVLGQRLQ